MEGWGASSFPLADLVQSFPDAPLVPEHAECVHQYQETEYREEEHHERGQTVRDVFEVVPAVDQDLQRSEPGISITGTDLMSSYEIV